MHARMLSYAAFTYVLKDFLLLKPPCLHPGLDLEEEMVSVDRCMHACDYVWKCAFTEEAREGFNLTV